MGCTGCKILGPGPRGKSLHGRIHDCGSTICSLRTSGARPRCSNVGGPPRSARDGEQNYSGPLAGTLQCILRKCSGIAR
eukprot:3271900-Heterocapsa_arctica.AAC.1